MVNYLLVTKCSRALSHGLLWQVMFCKKKYFQIQCHYCMKVYMKLCGDYNCCSLEIGTYKYVCFANVMYKEKLKSMHENLTLMKTALISHL